MGNSVEVDKRERVRVMHHLCNLQDLCHLISQKVWERATEAVGPAVELVGCADGSSSLGAQSIVDARIDKLDEQ